MTPASPAPGDFAGVLIIPTRNRFELAENAVRAALAAGAGFDIWVSDNSSDAAQADQLRRYCEGLGAPRLTYRRPPEPLPMGRHWDWILGDAADAGRFTHVSLMTDRLHCYPHALAAQRAVARAYPDDVICFAHDRVDDRDTPLRVTRQPWTGRVLRVPAALALAHGREHAWIPWAPRFMNGITPVAVIRDVRAAFGDICATDNPDVSFSYRLLDRRDAFLYVDLPQGAYHGFNRSNGRSHRSGKLSSDGVDFLKNLSKAGDIVYAHGPVPGLPTTINGCLHEYELIRRASRSGRLKPVNLARIWRLIEKDVEGIGEDETRRAYAALVAAARAHQPALQAGWADRAGAALARLRTRLAPRYLWRRLVTAVADLFDARRPLGALAGGAAPVQREVETTHAQKSAALAEAAGPRLPRRWGYSRFEYKVGGARLASLGFTPDGQPVLQA